MKRPGIIRNAGPSTQHPPEVVKIVLWQALEQAISDATGEAFRCENRNAVGGGCINDAFVLTGGGRDSVSNM